MEGKANRTKHQALQSEALEHLTPLVWHHDIWHMKVALIYVCVCVCVCVCVSVRARDKDRAHSRRTLTAFSLPPGVHPKTSSMNLLHSVSSQLHLHHPTDEASSLQSKEEVLHCSFISTTCTLLVSFGNIRSGLGQWEGGAAMTWRSPADWRPSSSSSSSSSSLGRAYRRSTRCRVRPAGGVEMSPAQWCWPPPGYPPPEGTHTNQYSIKSMFSY